MNNTLTGKLTSRGNLNGNVNTIVFAHNYNDLTNKPSINNVTLQGNKTASELGLATPSDIPVTSVNDQTGDVVLSGSDIDYSIGMSLNAKIDDLESQIQGSGVQSVNGMTGNVTLTSNDINYSTGVTIKNKIDSVEGEIPDVYVSTVNGNSGAVTLTGSDIIYSGEQSINGAIDSVSEDVSQLSEDLSDLTGEDIPMSGTDSTPVATAVGDLSQLSTSVTSSLVGAVNELTTYIPVWNNTASGSIATFDTSLALPLQDCTININAVQESGTPTPSSPKAISGFTGANIRNTGSNLWDEVVEEGYINSSGTPTANAHSLRSKNFLPCTPNTAYYCYISEDVIGGLAVCWYDINQTFISRDNQTHNVTSPANARFFKLSLYNYKNYYPSYANNVSLNYPATDTAYHAYNANSHTTAITWQDEAGTVYGGSLDVTSGVLTVTHGFVDMGTLSWNNASGNLSSSSGIASDVKAPSANTEAFKGLCSCYEVAPRTGIADKQISVQTNGNIVISDTGIASMTGAQVQTYLTGFVLVYELATPVTYQLTPTQINAIVGTNNVFTDTNGDTSVVYACSLKDYIDGQ